MKLTLKPLGILGSRYELSGSEGRLAILAFTWGTLHGRVQLGGERLKLTHRFFSTSSALERGTRVLVEAKKERLFSDAYRLRSAEGDLRLEADGLFRASYRLMRAGQCVGRIQRLGMLRSYWKAHFDESLSLELCAFVLFHLASLKQESQVNHGVPS